MDLTGFLFGNVNEEGELEDESVLDKVGCRQARRSRAVFDLKVHLPWHPIGSLVAPKK